MSAAQLNEYEKKELVRDILGSDFHSVGNHFPLFSRMLDGLGHLSDGFTAAELVPTLSRFLSGSISSAILSTASFMAAVIQPLQHFIKLVNANETGLRMYSYRAVAYTLTAWAFGKPVPNQSARVIENLGSGDYRAIDRDRYGEVWRETSRNVLSSLRQVCLAKDISEAHLQAVFKALGDGDSVRLSRNILEGFEGRMNTTVRNIWKSGYSINFPG
ncbi:hypothetical protein [Microbulbifer halophilus]|uniref:Uncharacterized protein n=1 Tax=Microbulbifer halophilus TaxID=453963 RepID=A0ABW5EGM0_9GAMM|nr:hypothetical protein [Microbulbifer halophilus]MCW8127060.1 hypothetical protein [Microbulbifer halophilus]